MPANTQATISQPGLPMFRAMSAGTMKMPDPIITPMTTIAESNSPGLFDSAMVVIGVMIGSGIFIVPADMARNIGSPGWLMVAWVFAGILTISAALSYGELASMMPR